MKKNEIQKPKNKLELTPYYIGLDIGTNSVGWSVTNLNYEVLKFNGKRMWGARLFEEANTSAERRMHRSNRRRLERRKFRLSLLEEIFSEEISKIDMSFFIRLKESKYYIDDRSENNYYTLFNDGVFNDKEYYKKYPTIYHLRAALIKGEKCDIRELFLGIHHIVKYRGHFLDNGDEKNISGTIKSNLKELIDNQDFELGDFSYNDEILFNIEKIIVDKSKNKSDKVNEICNCFPSKYKKQCKEIFKLSLGLSTTLDKIFLDDELKELDDIKKISFNSSYEENINKYENALNERFFLIETAKKIYDAVSLSSILIEGKNFSESKVFSYEKHKQDLKLLKSVLKKYDMDKGYDNRKKSLYFKILKEDSKNGLNYVNYIGKGKIKKKISQEEFYKFLKKELEKIDESVDKQYILNEIELENFLPLQKTKLNRTVPHQLQLKELNLILENYCEKFKFLNQVEDGISNKEKIVSLFKFKIPYYVGPLNDSHKSETKEGFSWVVRRNRGKVLPWNFDKVIDVEASAEAFIKNMTNKCSQISTEDVLPKNSLLYSEFVLLNELNNITYDGEKIPYELKKCLVEEVFKKEHKKMTKTRIHNFIKSKGLDIGKGVIGGIDDCIKSDLKSYRDMERILGKGFDFEIAEKIILWITLFGGEKKLLERKIKNELDKKISEEQINKIKRLSYKDWGNLSKKFLTEIKSRKILNELKEDIIDEVSIIEALRYTNNNLSELFSRKYEYNEVLLKYNERNVDEFDNVEYSILDDIYASPAVKRSIWQSIKIVEEIKGIMKHEPEKIFIEATRSNKADKKRTNKRKENLINLYNGIKDGKKWIKEISGNSDSYYRIKKVYLYYMQQGKCMYSGEYINLEELFTDSYDIDHIYPRSLTKDDSLNNLVLVKAKLNRDKSDIYPVPPRIREKCGEFWKKLKDTNFLDDIKYNRLVRSDPLTQEELSGFISRQIVHTSQSTKAAANYLGRINTNSRICWVKAENISDFRNGSTTKREKNDKPKKFIKFRELNDHHHAKDAYLNIVVGNVFDEKFTKNPMNFFKEKYEKSEKYNLQYMFKNSLERNGNLIWDYDIHMPIIEKMMRNNDVRITKMCKENTGKLFDETIYKANITKEDSYFPIKKSDEKLNKLSKYGGYSSIKIAYYMIVKCVYLDKNKNKIHLIKMIPIPIYIGSKDSNLLKEYISKMKRIQERGKELISIEILYNKLLMNSLVCINGYYYYVGGKTDNYFYAGSALQIVLDEEIIMYIKLINTYFLKKENFKDLEIEEYFVSNGVEISHEKLIEMYFGLVNKLGRGIFTNKKNNKYKDLVDEKTILEFKKLSLENKSKIILSILSLLTEKKTLFNELKLIGMSDNIEKRISMNLSNLDSFIIINRSITGLFENIVNILEK